MQGRIFDKWRGSLAILVEGRSLTKYFAQRGGLFGLRTQLAVRAVDGLRLVSEPLRTHTDLRGEGLAARVVELLEQVGLEKEHLYRYPHEFSGGQRQRIAVVRVLAMKRRLRSPKCVGSEFPC